MEKKYKLIKIKLVYKIENIVVIECEYVLLVKYVVAFTSEVSIELDVIVLLIGLVMIEV